MNILIGIVLYNPHVDFLINTIKTILELQYEVILVDNASSNLNEFWKEFDNKIYFIKNETNLGIAKALNQIMIFAKARGADAVLLLDHDSTFPFAQLKDMGEVLKPDIGIVAPVVYDSRFKKNVLNPQKKGIVRIRRCITSGSLTNVEAWEKIRGFDDRIFIDGVDFDFCERLLMNGYQIIQDNRVRLVHELGEFREKNYLLFKIRYSWHSTFRTYYIVRNIIYLERKYNNRGRLITFLRLLKRLAEILFLYDDKRNRILIYFKAICDGMSMEVSSEGVICL